MADSKPTATIEASNELVRWLQLLVLPIWARVGLVFVMAMLILGSLALLLFGLIRQEKESVSAAVTLMTVSLPVILVITALVFSQNGAQRLKLNTIALLEKELPEALTENLTAEDRIVELTKSRQGCCVNYQLVMKKASGDRFGELCFGLEINVRKVNVCFRLSAPAAPARIAIDAPELLAYRHVFTGAIAEGFQLNEVPSNPGIDNSFGVIFFRELETDFLLKPASRLYFCQDLTFFCRGVLLAQMQQTQSQEVSRKSPNASFVDLTASRS